MNRHLCYNGIKVCPFFSWNSPHLPAPVAACGALPSGHIIWTPADPVRVEPRPDCPLDKGPATVEIVDGVVVLR